jgi:mannose-6-phosphate isomerase-like protein (cupin superfamily)
MPHASDGVTHPMALADAFARIGAPWSPHVVAALNGQHVKLARLQGAFVWHHHDDADELFLVHRGRFRMEFRDRVVELGPGDLLVVPRGVEHRPVADDAEGAEVLLFEPAGTTNTGTAAEPIPAHIATTTGRAFDARDG